MVTSAVTSQNWGDYYYQFVVSSYPYSEAIVATYYINLVIFTSEGCDLSVNQKMPRNFTLYYGSTSDTIFTLSPMTVGSSCSG